MLAELAAVVPWAPAPTLTTMSPNSSASVSRPLVLMVSWNCWPRGHGRLADLPGRHLDVLLGDGGDHVEGVEVKGRQPVRIEPGPHAVVALAEVADAGHALDAGQFVLEIDRRVIAQINRIVFVAVADQVDDQQRVRRLLLDGDPLVLDQGRDHRQGQRDAVLHQHLGHVRVGAHLKGHRQV